MRIKIRYDIAFRYATIGTEFTVCIGMMLGVGMWLDSKFKTSPVLMLSGFFLGFAAGLYWLIKQARLAQKDIETMMTDKSDTADKTE